MLDALIVGAGPAGLSAALILGRCRRRVVVIDDGRPRNRVSRAVHGFLSRDGIAPADLLQIARAQLLPYASVGVENGHVRDASCTAEGFSIDLVDGRHMTARTLLLATGMVDRLPDVPGFERFYGRGVYPCPYCDGWEVRDRPLAAYGRGAHVARLAIALTTWSDDVIVCTDGSADLSPADLRDLDARRIPIREEPLAALDGDEDGLRTIRFADGTALERTALFLVLGMDQRSTLAAKLGCSVSDERGAETDALARTAVPGLFVAGDASRDVALAVVAAAEGAEAALAMNKLLAERSMPAR